MRNNNAICLITATLVLLAVTAALHSQEMLLYKVDRPMVAGDGGFIWMFQNSSSEDFGGVDINQAMVADLTKPVNYADGSIHIYMQIKSMPQPQYIETCFNPYQSKGSGGGEDKYWYEEGTKVEKFTVVPGEIRQWSYLMSQSWVKKHDGVASPVDWSKPRYRQSLRFWGSGHKEMHSGNRTYYNANKSTWFPMDMLYMVVLVAKGETFGGWTPYLDNPTDICPLFDSFKVLRSKENSANASCYDLRGAILKPGAMKAYRISISASNTAHDPGKVVILRKGE